MKNNKTELNVKLSETEIFTINTSGCIIYKEGPEHEYSIESIKNQLDEEHIEYDVCSYHKEMSNINSIVDLLKLLEKYKVEFDKRVVILHRHETTSYIEAKLKPKVLIIDGIDWFLSNNSSSIDTHNWNIEDNYNKLNYYLDWLVREGVAVGFYLIMYTTNLDMIKESIKCNISSIISIK